MRVVLVLAVAALVGGLIWWSARGGGREPPTTGVRGTLAPDCEGSIALWVLSAPDDDLPFFERTLADLVASADPRIRFRIAYGKEEHRDALRAALVERRVPVKERVTWQRVRAWVWPWTRDLFLPGRSSDGGPLAFLHHPAHYDATMRLRWGADAVEAFVLAVPGCVPVRTRARLEGGMVVRDAERACVSEAAVEAALAAREARDEAQVVRGLQETWGCPVEVLPTRGTLRSQHVDLLTMPAGERQMVVGSPALGVELLESMLPAERKRFVASVRELAAHVPGWQGASGLGQDLVALLLERNRDPARRAAFAKLRARLEVLGYRCTEVPFLVAEPKAGSTWMLFSWTNVILDERDGKRTAYIPSYRLPALDRKAAEEWRRLGYRVVAVDALGPGLNGGGLRCMSQVFR